jgi:hypothetical protein
MIDEEEEIEEHAKVFVGDKVICNASQFKAFFGFAPEPFMGGKDYAGTNLQTYNIDRTFMNKGIKYEFREGNYYVENSHHYNKE